MPINRHQPPSKMNHRSWGPLRTTLVLALLLFVCGGATCARQPVASPFPPPPPVNFGEAPSLEQVANVVNRTAAITQLSTNSATVDVLSMPAVPKLNATMNLQRDKDFRLRASLPLLLGSGIDMGSNQELFWFEVPEGISKTLYFARHHQYEQQLSRSVSPVDPSFLIDALGLVQIDPKSVVAGPIRRADGKLEIRTTTHTPSGMYQRVLFVEPNAGYVTDQLVYDPSGTLVAQSSASEHVYYEAQGCVLPHQVKVDLVPRGGEPLTLQIGISSYTVNQLLSSDPNLFVIPSGASQTVDLTQLNGAMPSVQMPVPTSGPTAYTADASLAYPLRGMH